MWDDQIALRIKKVRQPDQVFRFVERTLKQGQISCSEAQDLLRDVRAKTHTLDYLEFCEKIGILDKRGDLYYPTKWGRKLAQIAQKDEFVALQELLGSLPVYYAHAELLLAELLLENALRHSHNITEMVMKRIPWFLQERLPVIQKKIGWEDSYNTLTRLNEKIHNLISLESTIDHVTWSAWDNRLGFAGLSDLTRAENLCKFLTPQHNNYKFISSEWFSSKYLRESHFFASLILLMLGQAGGRAVKLKDQESFDRLERFGLNLRRAGEESFLTTPVRLVFVDGVSGIEYYQAGAALMGENREEALFIALMQYAKSAATETPNQDSILVNLDSLQQKLHFDLDGLSPFCSSELADGADDLARPVLEVWQKQEIWHRCGSNFHQEALQVFQNGSHQSSCKEFSLPAILRSTPIHQAEQALLQNPYLYLLLMLLLDQPQTKTPLILEKEVWTYNHLDLVEWIDRCLVNLGFGVWNEGYQGSESRQLGQKLVDMLLSFQIVRLDFGQLTLSPEFDYRLQDDLAYLRNQTRQLRQRLRSSPG